MNVLNVEKVTKGYGDSDLFTEATLGISEGEKIGVIGINGTGKSTLLKMIAGLEEPDSGTITKGNGITVAYLPQNPEFPPNMGIIDYVLEGKQSKIDDWNLESEAQTILTKLGITDFDQKIEYLSGGQRKRVALARTLVSPADILILDEPTNHIDNEMADWLEQYLNKYRGVLIMVTHDRYFLDRVTNRIVEIDNGGLYVYTANYSEFVRLKAEREDMEAASQRKRQTILRTELEWMMRGARARSTKQKARIQRFEELKNATGLKDNKEIEMDSVGTRIGKKTVELSHICKAYDDRILINDFNYIILKNERIGIIGPNGCGKSTLIKMINGIISADSGTIELGDTIRLGYFAQENEDMDQPDIRVIDYIRNIAEYIETSRGSASASSMLERFLFPPAVQYTPVNKLSGGEKRRLYLLRILMGAPNVLILDEPTNDLDIATLTILEDYLDSFMGIVITVSHDRYFLDRVVDRIFAFEGNGLIKQYEGGFSDYLIAKENQEPKVEVIKENKDKNYSKPKQKKLKFTYMEQKEFDSIDDDIAGIEQEIEDTVQQMEVCASQYSKLSQLMEVKTTLEEQLEEKMERWIYLNDLAAQIEEERNSN